MARRLNSRRKRALEPVPQSGRQGEHRPPALHPPPLNLGPSPHLGSHQQSGPEGFPSQPRHGPPASPQTRPLMFPGWLCPRGLGLASGRAPPMTQAGPRLQAAMSPWTGGALTWQGVEQVPGTDRVQGSCVNWVWRARGRGHTRFFTTSPCESPEWPPFLDCLSAVTGACQESHIGFCL